MSAASTQRAEDERNDKQNKRDPEKKPRSFHRCSGYAAEAQNACDQGDDKKNNRPVEKIAEIHDLWLPRPPRGGSPRAVSPRKTANGGLGSMSPSRRSGRRDDVGKLGPDCIERGFGLGAVGPASLRHVRAAAAPFAAERRSCAPDKIDRADACCEVGRDRHDDTRLAIRRNADERDDA